MIGAADADNDEKERTESAGKKERFPLGAYNRAKKDHIQSQIAKRLQLDRSVLSLQEQINKKTDDLQQLEKQLHNAEEKIRRKKRKIDETSSALEDDQSSPPLKIKSCSITSILSNTSDRLKLSRNQRYLRRKSTLKVLRPIHCRPNTNKVQASRAVSDGMKTTLIGTTKPECMKTYIEKSEICTEKIIPAIVKEAVRKYEGSNENKVRSMRVLYEGGLIASRKYTKIRNGGDAGQTVNSKKPAQFMPACPIPKYIPYKSLISYIRNIDIGEISDLEELAKKFSLETAHGMFRPLTPFLLRLADHYLLMDSKVPCLSWFKGERNVFYVAVGADGAPFGRDDTATAYLVSILNILKKVQSCDDNHLLLGANCPEDHPLLKRYTKYLSEEMEKLEGKPITTPNGNTVTFKIQLIPGDMKWVASMSGELSNAAHYFSSFANVNKQDKVKIGGSIGNSPNATWQTWDYNTRLQVVQKVDKFKVSGTQNGRKRNSTRPIQRGEVTKFIAQAKSRQEFIPPLGKYVDLIKAEPLHVTNNAWQHWFTILFSIVMEYTDKKQLKSATALSDMPRLSTLIIFVDCLKLTAKCSRLYNAITRWFSEKRSKGIEFAYRFTGLESKNISWYFGALIEVLLKIPTLENGTMVKLHGLHFVALKLRDASSIYSRVEITCAQVEQLNKSCEEYFTAVQVLFERVNPTVWTVGYAVPFHTKQMFDELGYGLGLNSMQGREAKHVKLKNYVNNTCNVRKQLRWAIVFRHEFVSLLWLREIDPYHVSGQGKVVSYIPKKVQNGDCLMCNCGLSKPAGEEGCKICTSDTMSMIRESIQLGRVTDRLRNFATHE